MMAELLNLKAAAPGPGRHKSVVRGAPASGPASRAELSFPPVIAILLFRLGMEWVSALLNRKGGPHMIALNIPRPRRAERTSLCEGCVFAHIIRGFEPREVLVFFRERQSPCGRRPKDGLTRPSEDQPSIDRGRRLAIFCGPDPFTFHANQFRKQRTSRGGISSGFAGSRRSASVNRR